MSENKKDTFNSIQILRALAALFVVYYHATQKSNEMAVFGSFGVEIFFVISGFIMSLIAYEEQSSKLFAVKRIVRIIPLYWLLTTFLLFISAIKPNLLNSTLFNLPNYLKSIFFIPYYKESGAFQPYLAVGWTLNYEMFFYLCIFLSLSLFKKAFFYTTITILCLFYTLSFYIENKIFQAFFNNKLLFDFVFGMLAFMLYQKIKITKFSPLLLLGILLICFSFLLISESIGVNIDRLFIFGIPSTIILIAMLLLEKFINVKNNFIFLFFIIGDASYAIYLSHLFVIQFMFKILHSKLHIINSFGFFGVTFSLISSVIIGYILFKYIDLPLRQYIKKKIASFYI